MSQKLALSLLAPLILSGAALPSLLLPAPSAQAACEEVLNPETGQVTLVCDTPGSPGGDGGGGGGTETAGTGTGSGGGASETCEFQGEEIPCNNGGAWNPQSGCWLRLASPQKPPPPGKTDADGNWYDCVPPPPHVATTPPQVWIDGGAAAISYASPAELARRALASLNLQPIEIGIVPKDEPGKVGLIGLPTWMWVEDPDATTWGPASASAADGPITVNLTAQVESVTWRMGDGTTISCGKGTPYKPAFGDQSSPDCGHRYELTSAREPAQQYAVSAESHWVAEWTGAGQSGTIEFTLEADTQIQIGELQVLTQ